MKIPLPHRISLAVLLLGTASWACAAPAVTPSPVSGIPAATFDASELWALRLGDVKADQAWGVDVDPGGNIYLAAFEQEPGQWFTDMTIYKLLPDGTQVWRTRWGGTYQEKAFIIAVREPVVYVGGLTHTAASPTEADMAVLALDAGSGQVLWEFTWGQGFGYEEVDGLVVEEDAIYISGWSTSEGDNYDIAVIKLDHKGELIWQTIWGSTGFDTADGQMVATRDDIYITGKLNGVNYLVGGQAYVACFSKENGTYLDHFVYQGGLMSEGLGMTGDGQSLYVAGMDFIAGQGNWLMLLKLDPSLDLLWDRHWGEVGGEYISRTAAINGQGEILVAVNQRIPNSAPADIVLLRYTPEGVLLSVTRWGGMDEELAYGIVIRGPFAYIAGEIKYMNEPQGDILLIKADALQGGFPTP